MKLIINNKPTSLQVTSLQELLTQMDLHHAKGIAVAVNNKVVQRTTWQHFQLTENDSITIIRATQGG